MEVGKGNCMVYRGGGGGGGEETLCPMDAHPVSHAYHVFSCSSSSFSS